MIERFDLFLVESEDRPTWVGSAQDIQAVRSRILQIASGCSPRRFLLLDQTTGAKSYLSSQDVKNGVWRAENSSDNAA